MMYTTYILHSLSHDRYYIGHTSNIEDRLIRHNSGRSKYTKHGIPWELIYSEVFYTKTEAYQRELEIKKRKSRIYIEKLISG